MLLTDESLERTDATVHDSEALDLELLLDDLDDDDLETSDIMLLERRVLLSLTRLHTVLRAARMT